MNRGIDRVALRQPQDQNRSPADSTCLLIVPVNLNQKPDQIPNVLTQESLGGESLLRLLCSAAGGSSFWFCRLKEGSGRQEVENRKWSAAVWICDELLENDQSSTGAGRISDKVSLFSSEIGGTI